MNLLYLMSPRKSRLCLVARKPKLVVMLNIYYFCYNLTQKQNSNRYVFELPQLANTVRTEDSATAIELWTSTHGCAWSLYIIYYILLWSKLSSLQAKMRRLQPPSWASALSKYTGMGGPSLVCGQLYV